ncbi:MAG: hypothetical protein WKG03_09600, partial [Telluria sp.]
MLAYRITCSALGAITTLLCCASLAAPAQTRVPAASARLAPGQSCIPAWPESAIGKGRSGTTGLLLRVGPDGAVV